MKRVYKKSKKLLQASSLLALALGSPLKAMDFESPADRDTRAVAKQFAAEHPIEQGDPLQLSSYIERRNVAPDIVDYLPDNTRGGLLRSIGMLSNDEFTLEHKLLVNSVFETLKKDQTDSLQLSFNENQIMGRHKLLGRELIDLTRFFGDADSNYFNTLKVGVKVDDAVKNQDILFRLSQSGISHLRLDMDSSYFQGKKVDRTEKIITFFQSGWDRLVALDLAGNSISDGEAIVISGSHALENLLSLDIGDNNFGDVGLIYIAKSRTLENLQILNLSRTKVGDDGLMAIANSPTLGNLLKLNLEGNHVGDDGLMAIANSPTLAKLLHLNLKFNNIKVDGVKAIANSLTFKNLLSLELTYNQIGVKGFIAIANSETLSNLENLDLAANTFRQDRITGGLRQDKVRDGIIAIANSKFLKNLLKLNLEGNHVGDDGGRAIAESQTLGNLQILNLNLNNISDDVKTAIRNNPIFANTEIIFERNYTYY